MIMGNLLNPARGWRTVKILSIIKSFCPHRAQRFISSCLPTDSSDTCFEPPVYSFNPQNGWRSPSCFGPKVFPLLAHVSLLQYVDFKIRVLTEFVNITLVPLIHQYFNSILSTATNLKCNITKLYYTSSVQWKLF